MDNTHLDEIVEFPERIGLKLWKSQPLMALIYNDPNIDIDSPEVADTLFEKYIFDYDYIDGTTQDVKSVICIDTNDIRLSSSTIKDVEISILVAVHKNIMSLKNTPIVGVSGNRRDNIIRIVDFILRDCNDFGVGLLELKEIRRVDIGNNSFTAKELVYTIPTFAKGKVK